jgi:hypothetical protein
MEDKAPHLEVSTGPALAAPGLELAMQELEALEAPGWWTAIGVSAGVSAVSVASYIGVTIATT